MRVRRVVVLLAVTSLLLGGCGGTTEPVGDRPPRIRAPALPDPVPAEPGFHIVLRRPAPSPRMLQVESVKGVAVASPVRVATMRVGFGGRAARLRVAAVEPFSFRSVAPDATKSAAFVWSALVQGRAVLTSTAAERLGFDGPGAVRIDGREIDVGALADMGNPDLADVVVADHLAARLGLPAPTTLVVGVGDGARRARVRRSIDHELGRLIARIRSLAPERLPAAAPAPEPIGLAENSVVGRMAFRVLKGGFISPDPAWVATNIATGEVPILGRVTCHRALFPQLGTALAEIERAGLRRAIDVGDYGGCYVPRFIDRDPRRGLSAHAFGLAIDLNVSRNQLGTRGHMHPDVVAIFEKWGFVWGGRWSRPDPMHFELGRLIRP